MKSIEEMRVEYADDRATIANTIEGDPIEEPLRERLEKHLSHFLAPREGCPMCERPRLALSWALVHGAMVCVCGYPATAYHFLYGDPDEQGEREQLARFEVILYAHPSEVTRR